jgi:hypothetical protein
MNNISVITYINIVINIKNKLWFKYAVFVYVNGMATTGIRTYEEGAEIAESSIASLEGDVQRSKLGKRNFSTFILVVRSGLHLSNKPPSKHQTQESYV